MEKVDKLDRRIMAILAQNARIAFKEVAEACGVSRAAVHQRVERLKELGVMILEMWFHHFDKLLQLMDLLMILHHN